MQFIAQAGQPASHPSELFADMVLIPGGAFWMGSDNHYPEEAPTHRVSVAPFRIDRTPVTNRQFKQFVAATGYVTVAEIAPDPKDYPGALPHMLKAGSLVFTPPSHAVDLRDWSQWWRFAFGADWRHPLGRGERRLLDEHPVVHIAYQDAEAYAAWAGKQLPTEAEWEFAARAGLDGAEFAWGDDLTPGGRHMANTWQGEFPRQNLATDGYQRTSPVTAFPPNAYGVYDMIAMCGNGPRIGSRHATAPMLRKPAASRRTRAAQARRTATTRAHRRCVFHARWSKAGRICALPITAAAIGLPRAMRSRSTRA